MIALFVLSLDKGPRLFNIFVDNCVVITTVRCLFAQTFVNKVFICSRNADLVELESPVFWKRKDNVFKIRTEV